jgi:hypothetical protein
MMKKILRSIWKGALFGAALGFFGGVIFKFIFAIGQDGLLGMLLGFIPNPYIVLPGLGFGICIGKILGFVFVLVPVKTPVWLQAAIASLAAGGTHYIIFYLMEISRNSKVHRVLLFFYRQYWIPIVIIYLLAAICFGVYFHRKSVWTPKFIREE